MTLPRMSGFYEDMGEPSIRGPFLAYEERADNCRSRGEPVIRLINVAPGNVSLKTYPSMVEEYNNPKNQMLIEGIWPYSLSSGEKTCRDAFMHAISAITGNDIDGMYSVIGKGSSDFIDIVLSGICGPPGSRVDPLLAIDPCYPNYKAIGKQIGRSIVAIPRTLQEDGTFTKPGKSDLESAIHEYKPNGLLIIPYDNPTGQVFPQETIDLYEKMCLEHGIWLVSDEAYLGLNYMDNTIPSILSTDPISDVPNRIGLYSASKIFNACGLRIGMLLTDNKDFYKKTVYTIGQRAGTSRIDQDLVAILAKENKEDIAGWIHGLKNGYESQLSTLRKNLSGSVPGLIVSEPEGSIYVVCDFRNVLGCGPDFDAKEFIYYCAKSGCVDVNGTPMTMIAAPMKGFYAGEYEKNPGRSQMRIACVETPDNMAVLPQVFSGLLGQYLGKI